MKNFVTPSPNNRSIVKNRICKHVIPSTEFLRGSRVCGLY